MYGVELVEGLPALKRFYEGFGDRESASVEGLYDENLVKVTSHWIKEEGSWAGAGFERLRMFPLYLSTVPKFFVGLWWKK